MYEEEEEDFPQAKSSPPKLSKSAPAADEFNVGVSIRLLEARLRMLNSRKSKLELAIEGHQTAINGLKQILNNEL